MGNIMINEKCNLQCPYCFASEFTLDKVTKNMSIEDFKYALNFLLSDGSNKVGIIGGEPTLHPQFMEIMKIVIEDERVDKITLFTNGTNLIKHIKIITHPKVGILINYNSPNDIGEKQFERINENLRVAHEEYFMGDRITLGINMYKPNFDYKYMIEAVKKYDKKYVRTSISIPMDASEMDPLEHMESMKPSVFKFFRELEGLRVVPGYDCNTMPPCITTEEEKEWLKGFYDLPNGFEANLLSESTCSPVIDINVDLIAIRCFGLSEDSKADIRKFNNVYDLYMFYFNQIDSFKYVVYASEKCKTCSWATLGKCTGACLGYKINKINKARELVEISQVGENIDG